MALKFPVILHLYNTKYNFSPPLYYKTKLDKLKINLKHRHGIKSLEYEFDFVTNQNIRTRAYAIYAPNGIMKTSFARTFDDLSFGRFPKDERFASPSIHVVEVDGTVISKESIYVLKSENEI